VFYELALKVLQLALKVETQLRKKNEAKRSSSYDDYYNNSWKGNEKKKHDKLPSKNSHDPPTKTKLPRASQNTPNSSQVSRLGSIKCFKFLRYGDIALNSPTKITMTINPKGDVK